MKLNRKLVLVLALVLSFAMATSSTLAYLTATDSDENVMTLGKVEIDQIELERIDPSENAAGNKENFQSFEQNKPLYPVVGNIESADVAQQLPYGGEVQLWSDDVKNTID